MPAVLDAHRRLVVRYSPRPNPNTARMRWKICRRHPSAVDSTTSPLPKRSSCMSTRVFTSLVKLMSHCALGLNFWKESV